MYISRFKKKTLEMIIRARKTTAVKTCDVSILTSIPALNGCDYLFITYFKHMQVNVQWNWAAFSYYCLELDVDVEFGILPKHNHLRLQK